METKIEKLNDEIEKREETDGVRTNLAAVIEALKGNEHTIYLPQKDVDLMEETILILFNVGIKFHIKYLYDEETKGKLELQ